MNATHETTCTKYEHTATPGLTGRLIEQTALITSNDDIELWVGHSEGAIQHIGLYASKVTNMVVVEDDGQTYLRFHIGRNRQPVEIILDCHLDELDAAMTAAVLDRRAVTESAT